MTRKVLPVLLGMVLLGTAACGTRADDAAIEAAGNNATVATGSVAPGSTPAAAVPQKGPAAVDTAVQPAATGPSAVRGADSANPGKVSPVGSGKAVSPVTVAAPARCTAPGAPLVIGQVGVFSGLVGQSTGNTRLGMAVWAKAVNAAGGIACHPIQLYQADDGSDPAKTAALAQDMIETKRVVAFVGTNTPVTVAAFRSVVDRYKIPSIGGDLVTPDWFDDPLLFAQGGSPYAANLGGVKLMAKLEGATKFGATSCVEATACAYYLQSVTDSKGVAKAGLTQVAKQTSSLTQTDYTSVCQNFKNAGAQVAAVGLDSASLSRFARSCATIGFDVAISTNSLAVSSGLVNDQQLNKVGLYIGSSVSPYMVNETPAENTFHGALATYAPTQAPDSPTMVGWAAGKLLEAAIKGLGADAQSKPITTAAILSGMYTLKNETLGGLAPPLTFTPGQPSPASPCFFLFKLAAGKFAAPYGNKLQCL